MARQGLTLGKAYRLRKGSKVVGLALPHGEEARLRLVCWKRGKLVVHRLKEAVAIASEPDVETLCTLWGICRETLDTYVEVNLYVGQADVEKVRKDYRRKVR